MIHDDIHELQQCLIPSPISLFKRESPPIIDKETRKKD